MLLTYRYATFSWMYLLAGLFHETGMAFITYVCINLFFGINSIVSLSVVYFLSKEKPNDPVRSIISLLNFNKVWNVSTCSRWKDFLYFTWSNTKEEFHLTLLNLVEEKLQPLKILFRLRLGLYLWLYLPSVKTIDIW